MPNSKTKSAQLKNEKCLSQNGPSRHLRGSLMSRIPVRPSHLASLQRRARRIQNPSLRQFSYTALKHSKDCTRATWTPTILTFSKSKTELFRLHLQQEKKVQLGEGRERHW